MITIGIPTYKRTEYIRGALESCLNQTYDGPYEILVNDTSPNDTIRNLILGFESDKIRYIRNPESTTIVQKFNQLLEEAHGEWMLILCDDDLLAPKYLSAMMEKVGRWPRATIFRSRYQLIDKEGNFLRLDNSCKEYMSAAEFLSQIFLREKKFFKMNISGIMFPKELLQELGGFPVLSVPWHSDRLTWAVLGGEGGCAYDDRPLCSIRLHPSSLTSSFGGDLTSSLETDILAKHIFEGVLEKISKRNLSDADEEHLAQARKNLHSYMLRHFSRSLDHGFITYLSNQSFWDLNQLRGLLNKMKELHVMTFTSLPLYYLMSFLPQPIRGRMLHALKQYKVSKWCA